MASLQLMRGPEGAPVADAPENTLALVSAEVTVGRIGPVVLSHSGVSRRHARFFRAAGSWWVEDLASVNGTYVNGEKLIPSVPVQLCDGDRVLIPGFVYTFHDEPLPDEEPVIVFANSC